MCMQLYFIRTVLLIILNNFFTEWFSIIDHFVVSASIYDICVQNVTIMHNVV